MKLKNIFGREVNVNPAKYRVDWERVVSKPQKAVKDILRPYWENKNVCEEFNIPSSKMRVDILNFTDMIAVEVSPASTHNAYNEFFNKNRSNYLRAQKRDLQKAMWCENNGFVFIEISEADLKIGGSAILDKIYI